MAFSGGGTNVNGVQSIQPGILTTDIVESSSITENGTTYIDLTVPAGYTYILKGVNAYKNDGTYNVSISYFIGEFKFSTTTPTLLSNDVYVGVSEDIRARLIVTDWSLAGTCKFQILYQKVKL